MLKDLAARITHACVEVTHAVHVQRLHMQCMCRGDTCSKGNDWEDSSDKFVKQLSFGTETAR